VPARPRKKAVTAKRAPAASQLKKIRLVAFDFDGVFTDNTVLVSDDGHESVRCWRSDGLGLRELERAGVAMVIVSTETNAVVRHRSAKLKVRCYQGCEDKLQVLTEIITAMGISFGEVAFVGNDSNDLACLRAVGFPVVVADAHPSVRRAARYRTRLPGGRGAVREVCDLISGAHDRG
jgi:3-deoxy-D-manno-octulosonate 8-phosphate phosphatase (KDO 8-P phosphatase)